jgi:hypothetical protein
MSWASERNSEFARANSRDHGTTELFMRVTVVQRSRGFWKSGLFAIVLTSLAVLANSPVRAGIGGRKVDPEQVVPLNQLSPEHRDVVAEVIRDHTFHRQGEPDTFPCDGNLYLSLLSEPLVPLSLWKDLSDSPVRLEKVGPNRYDGTDGAGATATWEFALRTAPVHVLLAHFNYVSPRGAARVEARIVLVVRASYVQDTKKEPFVQHTVDAFVKVDSLGWKTLARTARPVIERVLEEQVREAGYFISLMSKLVVTYPNWAGQVIASQPAIDDATKRRFRAVVAQNAKPGASRGRPIVSQPTQAQASNADSSRR